MPVEVSMGAPASGRRPQRDPVFTVNSLAASIGEGRLPAGDIAELRRLDPTDPSSAAFWKIAGSVLEPDGWLRGGSETQTEDERRWAIILRAIAALAPLHTPGRRFGAALAEGQLSEIRFVRLLRARGEMLRRETRTVASFLASKAVRVDLAGLASLVLSEGAEWEEDVRRCIARDYYGELARNTSKQKKSSR